MICPCILFSFISCYVFFLVHYVLVTLAFFLFLSMSSYFLILAIHSRQKALPSVQFSSVQLLSCVQLFMTPWTAACQVSQSITKSQRLLKLMSIESVMPSNHLSHPLSSPTPPAFNLSQHQGLFK